ncbi:hypothetical protein JHD50_07045 [Sulfurimonas sp. MAG313]|nr:hypothetical protein [Sulfurimonas sp. MAG313]MDF1881063.1 hypothetical protein [Sulfurimonas sp. MAG313]
MHLSFKPDHIVSKNIDNEVLLCALKEAFDLRLRRHDQPKTAELQKLLLQIVPMQEIQALGIEHLPYFLDCYSAWLILEYLHRNKKISMLTINLQKMFDFEYLDAMVRKHEDAYVSMVQKMRNCAP